MYKKAEADLKGLGVILGVFIVVIIGLAFFQGAIAPAVGGLTNTVTASNITFTAPAAAGTTTLLGQAASSVVVTNATGGETVPATNYTISNYQVVNGDLRAVYTQNAGPYASKSLNISYVYEPTGYPRDTGSRAVIQLVLIMAALMIAVVAIKGAYDNGFFDMFSK
jgi:hypothetical protein